MTAVTNRSTGWRPSRALAEQGFGSLRRLNHVIISHADQDHVADLANVVERLKPSHVWQHPQLQIQHLSDLKATLSKAQAAYLNRSKTIGELQPLDASRQFKSMALRLFYLPIGSVRACSQLQSNSRVTCRRACRSSRCSCAACPARISGSRSSSSSLPACRILLRSP